MEQNKFKSLNILSIELVLGKAKEINVSVRQVIGHCQLTDMIVLLSLLSSDVLALPIFKQEESNLPPDTENKILPFQYVLCAATSPAIKLHDETLTYLNQGQHLFPSHSVLLNFV